MNKHFIFFLLFAVCALSAQWVSDVSPSTRQSEALSHMREAERTHPKDVPILFGVANELCAVGCHNEELSIRNQIVSLEPDASTACYSRSYAEREVGLYSKALVDADRAIELSPTTCDRHWSFWLRGIAYSKLGQHEKCISDCSIAIKMGGDWPVIYRTRAWSHLMSGHLVEAVSDGITAQAKQTYLNFAAAFGAYTFNLSDLLLVFVSSVLLAPLMIPASSKRVPL